MGSFSGGFPGWCLALLVLVQQAWAVDIDQYLADYPVWAERPGFDPAMTVPLDEIRNGIYYLAADRQLRVPAQGEKQVLSRFVYKLVNDAGVEDNAQLDFKFDPRYETLQLHELKVWRDGEAQDRREDSSYALLRREEGKEYLIYDGQLTLNVIVNDLRVGDIIEYSYSIFGSNPILQDTFAFSRQLDWSVPVGSALVRILWGKDRPLHHRVDGDSVEELSISERDGFTEYRYQMGPEPAIFEEYNTPDWFFPWRRIQFSELERWGDVSRLMAPLYEAAIQDNARIRELAERLTADASDSRQKVAAILRYVQDDIRYLGIEIAENAYMPSDALDTLERGYGDCKDKTVLTISLLEAAGIEASPLLVNASLHSGIKHFLPSVAAFDHVIVHVELGDQQYWLDPTRKYQYGAIDTIYQPNYELGLLVGEDGDQLIPAGFDAEDTFVSVHDTFDLTAGSNQPAVFTVSTRLGGLRAEQRRDYLAQNGLKVVQQEFKEFYQSYYSDIDVLDPVRVDDDETGNQVVVEEHYRINNLWTDDVEDQEYEASFYSSLISPYLRSDSGHGRTQPYYLAYPLRLDQRVELRFEPGASWYFEDEEFVEENAFFNYRQRVSFDKGSNILYLDYDYTVNAPHVPASDYSDYLAALERVDGYRNYHIYTSYADAEAESETAQESIPWEERIVLAVLLLYVLAAAVFIYLVARGKHVYPGEAVFYPVSLVKLTTMYLLSGGLYGAYWFYKNFKNYKAASGAAMMPLARAIFYPIWFFALFKRVREHAEEAGSQMALMSSGLALLCFLGTWIASGMGTQTGLALPSIFLGLFSLLPLAAFVNRVAGEDSPAYAWHSRWRLTSVLPLVLVLPLAGLGVGSEMGFVASEKVIKGEELPRRDIVFMQRKNILRLDDNVLYFYSDAFISNRSDGNGFTNRHVFSYWKQDGEFYSALEDYDSIAQINVEYSESWADNTVVEIVTDDEESFYLYFSAAEGLDKEAVERMQRLWRAKRR